MKRCSRGWSYNDGFRSELLQLQLEAHLAMSMLHPHSVPCTFALSARYGRTFRRPPRNSSHRVSQLTPATSANRATAHSSSTFLPNPKGSLSYGADSYPASQCDRPDCRVKES